MNVRKAGLIFVFILSLLFYSVYPGVLKGVKMDDSIKIGNDTLVLNGMALRKKFFFKVYVAGLYIPTKETDANKILNNDTKRVAVMHFMRSVSASKINGGWYDGLEDNTPDYSAELKKNFDKLASYMEDVKDGDRIVFTYIPGTGTKVVVKNKEKGTIAGKAFCDALFACWIGSDPGPGSGFKDDLLGK